MFKGILKSDLPDAPSIDTTPSVDQDKKYGGMSIVLENSCSTCRWWTPHNPTVCEAFPEGIPLVILMGFLDHDVAFGDEDLLYERSLRNRVKKSIGNYEELHPRYPKGSPKAGEFMPKGSPEYMAAREQSLDRFSAAKFVVGRSSTDSAKDDYHVKPETTRLREGFLIAKKTLRPSEMAEFSRLENELEDARRNGKESYKQHSKPDPSNPKGLPIYTPERLLVHNEIIAKLFKNAANCKPKQGEKPDYIMLGGLGGSGKSKFGEGATKVYDATTHLKLDNDAIKELLPEYDPQKAYLSHVEAGHIMDKARAKALESGLNLVIDSTMRKPIADELQQVKERGYNVETHFMHVSTKEAVGRALHRWLNLDSKGEPNEVGTDGKPVRGRLVPPSVILAMVENHANFDEGRKVADKWSFTRNNVPRGAEPIKVISSS